MGNTQTLPWTRRPKLPPADIFHMLDVDRTHRLTLKDLIAAADAGLMMPHSLPALYFFDKDKDGTLTHPEFNQLRHFCLSEKRKVEDAMVDDKPFRDLILRASRAGVKDCSVHGRSSFRRFSSHSNVRSVFSSRDRPHTSSPNLTPPSPEPYPSPESDPRIPDSRHSFPAQTHHASDPDRPRSESSVSSDQPDDRAHSNLPPRDRCVAMYSSQREFSAQCEGDDPPSKSDSNVQDPKNRTAIDAAVVENIMRANIHKLADSLHSEGSRENFMEWLWNLTNFNESGVVTLAELRVLLSALEEDGIDLEELVFYKEVGAPLEESIINEFDMSHAGLLRKEEFLVLADLITREYEFWENRHLERIGDYELGRTIGRGSSGVVRLAMHVGTREKVAVKIIKKGKCSDMSRLDREIQSLMGAKHEHIVALKEVLDSENNLFIVMELCGGGSLVDIVRLYPEERMPEETARFFMRQVFEALAFCHRNYICHRDVRLDNLLLDNIGNVKLTDFGHSGIYSPGWDLFSTSLVGSLYNLSPEQVAGQCYSGEKIDVWSAGVAVYCLLIGRPPFFEAEVQTLLNKIRDCDFEIPDFLSPQAADLIRCMIRAAPAERITIEQMLHHPWFYNGPEYGPCMNVVVIPVDMVFTKRPGVAGITMAITIYQHNLHFHLADSSNRNSAPEDQRGQEWTLKCLDPRNDIKFSVSLFTREPDPGPKNGRVRFPMSARSSCSQLPEVGSPMETQSRLRRGASTGNSPVSGNRGPSFGAHKSVTSAMQSLDEEKLADVISGEDGHSSSGLYGSRPPVPRRLVKITPLNIAAHIRDHADEDGDLFEKFEFRTHSKLADAETSREEMESFTSSSARAPSSRNKRKSRHGRSRSLNDSEQFKHLNRPAAVDAFPYQKVYPQREMPESARCFTFDKPKTTAAPISDGLTLKMEDRMLSITDACSTKQLYRFHRSATLNALSSFTTDAGARSVGFGNQMESITETDINTELLRHPSKAVSPQSPMIHPAVGPHDIDGIGDLTLTTSSQSEDEDPQGREHVPSIDKSRFESTRQGGANEAEEVLPAHAFQPYIEVRLNRGESGVFLKICRKLKTICFTKLAAAAEREKTKAAGPKTWSTLRRTSSSRSIDSEVTADRMDLSARATNFESRAQSVAG